MRSSRSDSSACSRSAGDRPFHPSHPLAASASATVHFSILRRSISIVLYISLPQSLRKGKTKDQKPAGGGRTAGSVVRCRSISFACYAPPLPFVRVRLFRPFRPCPCVLSVLLGSDGSARGTPPPQPPDPLPVVRCRLSVDRAEVHGSIREPCIRPALEKHMAPLQAH